MNAMTTAYESRPSRNLLARTLASSVLGRTEVDGWIIETVGTPADRPDPGQTITINSTATNVSDDSETCVFGGVESPCGRLTVPVEVDGRRVGELTFEAAVTGVPTESIDITVPDTGEFMVSVGGEETDIRTSEFEPPEPELNFVSRPLNVPDSVQTGETFSVSIEVGCTGVGLQTCPDRTLFARRAGRTIASEPVGGLAVADISRETLDLSIDQPGTHTVQLEIAGNTTSFNIDVEGAPEEEEPEPSPEDVEEPEAPTREPTPLPGGIPPVLGLAAAGGFLFILLLVIL